MERMEYMETLTARTQAPGRRGKPGRIAGSQSEKNFVVAARAHAKRTNKKYMCGACRKTKSATRPTPARTPDTGHRLRARPRRLYPTQPAAAGEAGRPRAGRG